MRHRPERLAQTVATLDRLRGGRAILGAGLGGVRQEFTAFGSTRPGGVVLDEALDVMASLWSAEEVHHRGAYYTVDWVRLAPRPRVPVGARLRAPFGVPPAGTAVSSLATTRRAA